MAELNEKQKRFCQEYAIDLNATQAAMRAGYSKKTAGQIGEQLLKKLEIQSELKRIINKISNKLEISAERVLNEYARIAFSDVTELFDEDGALKPLNQLTKDQAAVISSIEVDEIFEWQDGKKVNVGITRKIKLWDKPKGLEGLSKHLGLFEKDNGQRKPDAAPMTDDQVTRIIEALRTKK